MMKTESVIDQDEVTKILFPACLSIGFVILGILGWRLGNVYTIGVSVIGIILCSITSGLVISSFYLIDIWGLAMVASSLIFIPYRGMTRISINIPIGYLPFFLSAFVITLSSTRERGKVAMHSGNSSSDVFLYAVLFYCLVSSLWAIDYGRWFAYTMMWLVYMFTIYFPISISLRLSSQRFIEVLDRLYYSLGAIALIGISKYFLLGYADANPMPFINKNCVVGIFFMFVPVIIASYLNSEKKRYLLLLFILVLNMILIYSRMGYIAGAFGILAGVLLIRSKGKTMRMRLILLIGISFILLSITIYAMPSLRYRIIHRASSIVEFSNSLLESSAKRKGEADWRRITLMRTSLSMFRQSPIIGKGVGQYVANFPGYIQTKAANAHSLYLSYLTEFGIIGFLPLVLFLLFIFIDWVKNIRALQVDVMAIGYGFAVGQLTLLISFVGYGYITAPFVWFFWGLGNAFFRINVIEEGKKC